MDVRLASHLRENPGARAAARVIRQCVHCGFCNATCPTYQLLGDELDGPRGRIYQVREILEGVTPTPHMRLHLDRCLTCHACETTCPSGVAYGVVADFGREYLERHTRRPAGERLRRALVAWALPRRRLLAPLVGLARVAAPLLPAALRRTLPPRPRLPVRPGSADSARVLLHRGCVQPLLRPSIDRAAAWLLARSGHPSAPVQGCCGAIEFHLGRTGAALRRMRANLDRWSPLLEGDEVTFVSTASGCAAFLKRYPTILAQDPHYAPRARRLATRLRELAALVDPPPLRPSSPVAFHAPCTLRHHLREHDRVMGLLRESGVTLVPTTNPHLCCGSAGTYSLFQPGIAAQLRARKLADLSGAGPRAILTANIGCLAHLQAGTELPVLHWAEWLVMQADS